MKSIINITVKGFESAIISENEDSFFVDLGLGLGEGEYPKKEWSLEKAIEDQANYTIE